MLGMQLVLESWSFFATERRYLLFFQKKRQLCNMCCLSNGEFSQWVFRCSLYQGNRRETRLLGILSFVHSTVWKVLFGKVSHDLWNRYEPRRFTIYSITCLFYIECLREELESNLNLLTRSSFSLIMYSSSCSVPFSSESATYWLKKGKSGSTIHRKTLSN